jgi:hypothetical protein
VDGRKQWNIPGKRKLCDGAAQLFGDLGEIADLLDLGLALLALKSLDGALEEALVGGEAAVLGDAIVVLASEETRGKRRPDGGTVLVLVVEGSVLNLEALTVEGVVLGLLGDGSDKVVPRNAVSRVLRVATCERQDATHFSAIWVASMI